MLAQALTQAPDFLKIDIRIFVTGSSQPPDSLDFRSCDYAQEYGSATAESTPTQIPISEKGVGIPPSSVIRLIHLSSVKVSQGRPMLAKLLAEEAEDTRCGSMWVTGKSGCFEMIFLLAQRTQSVDRIPLPALLEKDSGFQCLGLQ